MECKYLKRVSDPQTRTKSVTVRDDAPKSDLWLCRYELETHGGEGLVKHCPFKFGPDEKCLFENEGGPFPPDKHEDGKAGKPTLKIVK